jgi:kumamolisin
VVWNDGSGNGASGGGVSETFPLPAYQQSANVPVSVNTGFVGRGVPDVAGDADPDTGYNVEVDGQAIVVGGTSAVAPLWAGLIALLNQQLGKSVGFLNNSIYGALSTTGFNDIVSGNNGAYSAGPGWDACTGWGSPIGTALLGGLGGQTPAGN